MTCLVQDKLYGSIKLFTLYCHIALCIVLVLFYLEILRFIYELDALKYGRNAYTAAAWRGYGTTFPEKLLCL